MFNELNSVESIKNFQEFTTNDKIEFVQYFLKKSVNNLPSCNSVTDPSIPKESTDAAGDKVAFLNRHKMGLISWIVSKAKKFYLNYSMVTSLYMMEPTEVVIINSVFVLMAATMAYSTLVYLPMYIWRLVTNPFAEPIDY